MALEALLPSEIARLVYGYLIEERCTETAKTFLNESPNLHECRAVLSIGRNFTTRVCGLTLLDILEKYCLLNAIVQEKLQKFDEADQLKHCTDLISQIKFLLEEYRNKRFVANCYESLSSNTFNKKLSDCGQDDGSKSKQVVFSKEELIQAQNQKNLKQVQNNAAVTEATPLENLPGYDENLKSKKYEYNVSKSPRKSNEITKNTLQNEIATKNSKLQEMQNKNENSNKPMIMTNKLNKNTTIPENKNNIKVKTNSQVQTSIIEEPLKVDKNIMTDNIHEKLKNQVDSEVQTSVAFTPDSGISSPVQNINNVPNSSTNEKTEIIEQIVDNLKNITESNQNSSGNSPKFDAVEEVILYETVPSTNSHNDPKVDIMNKNEEKISNNWKEEITNNVHKEILSIDENNHNTNNSQENIKLIPEEISSDNLHDEMLTMDTNVIKPVENMDIENITTESESTESSICVSHPAENQQTDFSKTSTEAPMIETQNNFDNSSNILLNSINPSNLIENQQTELTKVNFQVLAINIQDNLDNNIKTLINPLSPIDLMQNRQICTINENLKVTTSEIQNNLDDSTKALLNILQSPILQQKSEQKIDNVFTLNSTTTSTPIKTFTATQNFYTCDWFSTQDLPAQNIFYHKQDVTASTKKDYPYVYTASETIVSTTPCFSPIISRDISMIAETTTTSNYVAAYVNKDQSLHTPVLPYRPKISTNITPPLCTNTGLKNKTPTLPLTSPKVFDDSNKANKNDNTSTLTKSNNSNEYNKYYSLESIMLHGLDASSLVTAPLTVQEIAVDGKLSVSGLTPYLKVNLPEDGIGTVEKNKEEKIQDAINTKSGDQLIQTELNEYKTITNEETTVHSFNHNEIITKNTPKTLLESRMKNNRFSLSTPKKRSSYVRALNFDTPLNKTQSESKLRDKRFCMSPESLKRNYNKSSCKSSLFQSPILTNTDIIKQKTDHCDPVNIIQDSSKSTPIELDSVNNIIEETNVNEKQSVEDQLVSKKHDECIKLTEIKKESTSKGSWDSDLRKYLVQPETTCVSKKRKRRKSLKEDMRTTPKKKNKKDELESKKTKKRDESTPRKKKKRDKSTSRKEKKKHESTSKKSKKDDYKTPKKSKKYEKLKKRDEEKQKEAKSYYGSSKNEDEYKSKSDSISKNYKIRNCEKISEFTISKNELKIELRNDKKKDKIETKASKNDFEKKSKILKNVEKFDSTVTSNKIENKSETSKHDSNEKFDHTLIKEFKILKTNDKTESKVLKNESKIDKKTSKDNEKFECKVSKPELKNEHKVLKNKKKIESLFECVPLKNEKKILPKIPKLKGNIQSKILKTDLKVELKNNEKTESKVSTTESKIEFKVAEREEQKNSKTKIEASSNNNSEYRDSQNEKNETSNNEQNNLSILKCENHISNVSEVKLTIVPEILKNEEKLRNEISNDKLDIESKEKNKNKIESVDLSSKIITESEILKKEENVEMEILNSKKKIESEPLIFLTDQLETVLLNDVINEVEVYAEDVTTSAQIENIHQDEDIKNSQDEGPMMIKLDIIRNLDDNISPKNLVDYNKQQVQEIPLQKSNSVDYEKIETELNFLTKSTPTQKIEPIYDQVSKIECGRIVNKKYARLTTLDTSVAQNKKLSSSQIISDLETPKKDENSLQLPPTPQVLSPGSASLIMPSSKLYEDSRTLQSLVATPVECPSTPSIILTPPKTIEENTNKQLQEKNSTSYFKQSTTIFEDSKKPEITQFEVIKENLLKNKENLFKNNHENLLDNNRENLIKDNNENSVESKDAKFETEINNAPKLNESMCYVQNLDGSMNDSVDSSSSSSSSCSDSCSSSSSSENEKETTDIEQVENVMEIEREIMKNKEEISSNKIQNEEKEKETIILHKSEISPKKVLKIDKTDEELANTIKETPVKDENLCIEAGIFETPNYSKPTENPTNLNAKISQMMIQREQEEIAELENKTKPKIISIEHISSNAKPVTQLMKALPLNLRLKAMEVRNESINKVVIDKITKKSEEEVAQAVESILSEKEKFNKVIEVSENSMETIIASPISKDDSGKSELVRAIESITNPHYIFPEKTKSVDESGSELNLELVLEDTDASVDAPSQLKTLQKNEKSSNDPYDYSDNILPSKEYYIIFDEENYKKRRRKPFPDSEMTMMFSVDTEKKFRFKAPTHLEMMFALHPPKKKRLTKAELAMLKNGNNVPVADSAVSDNQQTAKLNNKRKMPSNPNGPINIKRKKKNIFVY